MIDKSIRYFEKGGEAKPIIGIDGKEYGSVEAMQDAMRQDHAQRMREIALRGGADEGFVNSDQFNQFLQENPHNGIYPAVVREDPYGFGSSPVTAAMAEYYTNYLTDTDQLSKIRRFETGKDLGPGRIIQPFQPPTEAPTDYPIRRFPEQRPTRPGPPVPFPFPEFPSPEPTPMPTPTPMPSPMPPTPVNPFQRPEAPSAPMPQPVNQYSPPPVMQTGPSMTPVTDFSFYRAPQQEIALTPAEVLARARNPFNRPT